jgi:hypothetical protein
MNISDINRINTKKDFLEFMEWMNRELKENQTQWVNTDLPDYLVAIQSWVEDMDGFYKNLNQSEPESINWSFLATVLIAAKYYE